MFGDFDLNAEAQSEKERDAEGVNPILLCETLTSPLRLCVKI